MLLEFVVWGSREWYHQALPMLAEAGLRDRPGLSWADPETDGEEMRCYFDLDASSDAVDAGYLADVLARVRAVVLAGEAPTIEIRFVPSPPERGGDPSLPPPSQPQE